MAIPLQMQALEFQLQKLYNASGEGDSIDYYFTDGDLRVFYRPPLLWASRGSVREFVATAPYPSEGRFSLRAVEPVKSLPVPGNKEGLNAYRAHFAQHLPAGATAARALEAHCHTVGGRNLPATAVTFSYELKGNTRLQTLIYAVYRPELWLEIRIESHKEDFSDVKAACLLSLEAFTAELRAAASTLSHGTARLTPPRKAAMSAVSAT